jgi:hypothetical protein
MRDKSHPIRFESSKVFSINISLTMFYDHNRIFTLLDCLFGTEFDEQSRQGIGCGIIVIMIKTAVHMIAG